MPMDKEYDIYKALQNIEDELIRSMIRNFDRHRAEEEKEGYNWVAWQAEQLKALEGYKRRNLKKYQGKFGQLNAEIENLILLMRQTGRASQEVSILEALKKGYQVHKEIGRATTEGRFFTVNDRKLNALIKATVNDMEKAEQAVLRMANDKYRKVIFNAQVYANTGAGTYEKAVDMAVKDMLSAGLNCVEYKNGARHTLANYARMAIKTANKRAYLIGEGEKRAEWGVHTVIVKKRGNACPLCFPFVGKVMIDDVYSVGSKKDGEYPLLSDAMEAGFLHPNCKDIYTTYFPGISTHPSEQRITKEEAEKAKEDYNNEQKQNYCKNNAERFRRMSENSLDEENKRKYAARAKEWEEKERSYQKVAGEGGLNADEKADYLIRANTPGQNINNERKLVNDVVAGVPKKVQEALNNGTVIDVGRIGASQYDYVHDILYVAKDANKEAVIHEIGHMVENKILDTKKVEKIKEKFLKDVPTGDIAQEVFYDASGNPVEIFLLKNPKFVSEYQGRLYVDDWSEIYDENWNIRSEILQEFVSEPFREYIENPERLKKEFPEFYELIREVEE